MPSYLLIPSVHSLEFGWFASELPPVHNYSALGCIFNDTGLNQSFPKTILSGNQNFTKPPHCLIFPQTHPIISSKTRGFICVCPNRALGVCMFFCVITTELRTPALLGILSGDHSGNWDNQSLSLSFFVSLPLFLYIYMIYLYISFSDVSGRGNGRVGV